MLDRIFHPIAVAVRWICCHVGLHTPRWINHPDKAPGKECMFCEKRLSNSLKQGKVVDFKDSKGRLVYRTKV
jgi:hypothetical protein